MREMMPYSAEFSLPSGTARGDGQARTFDSNSIWGDCHAADDGRARQPATFSSSHLLLDLMFICRRF